MIWKRADRKEDFPTFHHQDARIEALEADIHALAKLMVGYFEGDGPSKPSAQFIDELRVISKKLKDIK